MCVDGGDEGQPGGVRWEQCGGMFLSIGPGAQRMFTKLILFDNKACGSKMAM